ncbi:MAG: M48 family metalloprotease [Chloroflexi bacterium]|nr:M48 family metalloprotease [Chloroflexota bacterium]
MDAMEHDPIARRLNSLRLATGLALGGFLINAGIVVLLVGALSGSVQASLIALGSMGAIVLILGLAAEPIFMRAAGARPFLEGEYPWLGSLMRDLAAEAHTTAPPLYVAEQEHYNAFAVGTGANARIIFFSGLLRDLPEDEVRAVAAHELGHVINRDTTLASWTLAVFMWVIAVKVAASAAGEAINIFSRQFPRVFADMGVFGQLFGIWLMIMGLMLGYGLKWIAAAWAFIALLMRLALFRQREFLADATGVALTGDPEAAARALARVEAGPPMSSGAGTIGALCFGPPFLVSGWLEELTATHPSTAKRIEELQKLPAQKRSFATGDWQGVGSFSLLLPAGAITVIGLLALLVPVLSSSGGGGGGRSPTVFTRPSPAPVSTLARVATVLSNAATPPPIATPISPPVAPTATTPSQPMLAYGDEQTGTVGAGAQQRWSFKGTVGEIVTVRVVEDGSASLAPNVQLLDPSGQSLGSSCDETEARIQNYKLNFTGTYTVVIGGCSSSSAGGYRLMLALKPPPGVIAYNSEAVGEIALTGDYQEWTFEGHEGDIVTIRMLEEGSASLPPRFVLLDPGHAEDGGACDDSEARLLNHHIRFTGTYTIHASGCNAGNLGGYRLILLLKPPPGTIAFGREVQGEIALGGDYQDWTFEAAAGDLLAIQMAEEASGSLPPAFDLLDAGGVVVASNCDDSEASVARYEVKFSGTYTIRARGCSGGSVGRYRLRLDRAAP